MVWGRDDVTGLKNTRKMGATMDADLIATETV